MREGQTLLHLSLSSQPRFHSRSFLFLAAPSSLSGVRQDLLREEDTSMLSACNRWQLWGRPWISAIAPVANYPNSSLGGPLLVTFAKTNHPATGSSFAKKQAFTESLPSWSTLTLPTKKSFSFNLPISNKQMSNPIYLNWPQMHILITSTIGPKSVKMSKLKLQESLPTRVSYLKGKTDRAIFVHWAFFPQAAFSRRSYLIGQRRMERRNLPPVLSWDFQS